MKAVIKFSNWKLPTHHALVLATGVVSSLMAFSDQFLAFLHEAPFPVSTDVDLWVKWLLRGATLCLTFVSIFLGPKHGTDEPTN